VRIEEFRAAAGCHVVGTIAKRELQVNDRLRRRMPSGDRTREGDQRKYRERRSAGECPPVRPVRFPGQLANGPKLPKRNRRECDQQDQSCVPRQNGPEADPVSRAEISHDDDRLDQPLSDAAVGCKRLPREERERYTDLQHERYTV
jgi:hypothetical protein